MTWDPTKPAGTDSANTIGTSTPGNFAALDTWASAFSTGVAQAGSVIFQMYRSANAVIAKFRAAAADTFDRFTTDLNGYLQWGSGAAATDCGLSRQGVGILQLDSGVQLRAQQDPMNANDVARKSYVDGLGKPTITVKKGSGSGSVYSTISATYVDVDATNLAYTVTVPTGQKMTIAAQVPATNGSAGNGTFVRIVDGTTAVAEGADVTGSTSFPAAPTTLVTVVVGDGASHTFKLQFAANSGTAQIYNNALSTTTTPSQGLPVMIFRLEPAN